MNSDVNLPKEIESPRTCTWFFCKQVILPDLSFQIKKNTKIKCKKTVESMLLVKFNSLEHFYKHFVVNNSLLTFYNKKYVEYPKKFTKYSVKFNSVEHFAKHLVQQEINRDLHGCWVKVENAGDMSTLPCLSRRRITEKKMAKKLEIQMKRVD